jgi:hypothetical protein
MLPGFFVPGGDPRRVPNANRRAHSTSPNPLLLWYEQLTFAFPTESIIADVP